MSPDTSQVLFRHEYEHELEGWLRRRFKYLCVTYLIIGALDLGSKALWFASEVTGGGALAAVVTGIGTLALLGIVAYFLFIKRPAAATRSELLAAAARMILLLGATSLLGTFALRLVIPQVPSTALLPLFFWHLTACLFLPWTARESLRPIVPLLTVWVVYTLVVARDASLAFRILSVIFSPGILIPGLMICEWRLRRHSRRFRWAMLGKHFKTLRQEFTRARTIHESLFPPEYDDGFLRFQYAYEPMRELGGDFVHLHVGPKGLMHMTLLDVTGHGLAAALTVNRIYGELERIRAESPRARPGEVLTLLNRYIYLTMVSHNIYATALALTLDPYVGELRWSSAGHPPAFLRGANGVVRELSATTLVLGALGENEFEANEQNTELSPDDVLVAYTDGAFEARDRSGRQFGLDHLRQLLRRQPPPANWPQFICNRVAQHKFGRAQDDVLVTALTFAAFRPQPLSAQPALATS